MRRLQTDFAVDPCPANMIVLQTVSAGHWGDNRWQRSLDLRKYLFVGQSPVLAQRITRFNWSEKVIDGQGIKSKWGSDKPSKLMTSLLAIPFFNSDLLESSSFRAKMSPWSMFRRRLCIAGSLELLNNHVVNPGNHPVTAMRKRTIRDGFPKAAKLVSRASG